MKLKNMNRGIALGIALALGTGIYVTVSNQEFKRNKDVLEKVLNDYCDTCVQSSIGNDDEVVTKWIEVVNKCYTDYSNTNDYGYHKEDILSELSHYDDFIAYDGENRGNNCIYEGNYEISNLKISKSGSNGAQVTFDCSLYFEFVGDPSYLFLEGIQSLDNEYYMDEPEQEDEIEDTAKYKCTIEYADCSVYLINTDDGWKVASATFDGGYSDNRTQIEEGSSTQEELSAEDTISAEDTSSVGDASSMLEDSTAEDTSSTEDTSSVGDTKIDSTQSSENNSEVSNEEVSEVE